MTIDTSYSRLFTDSVTCLHFRVNAITVRGWQDWWGLPANTRHWPNVILMLGRRRRRWANIKTTLGKWLVFAGLLGARLARLKALSSLEARRLQAPWLEVTFEKTACFVWSMLSNNNYYELDRCSKRTIHNTVYLTVVITDVKYTTYTVLTRRLKCLFSLL